MWHPNSLQSRNPQGNQKQKCKLLILSIRLNRLCKAEFLSFPLFFFSFYTWLVEHVVNAITPSRSAALIYQGPRVASSSGPSCDGCGQVTFGVHLQWIIFFSEKSLALLCLLL